MKTTLPAPPLDLSRNVSWQYDEADRFKSLVKSKQAFYDANYSNFWANWFTSIFDLKDNPNQFGLIVWCIILGVPINIAYSPPDNIPPFGFGFGRDNFGDSNFTGLANVPTLTTDEAKRLLRMKYYSQTISPTPYNINFALADVFGDLGKAFIQPSLGGNTKMPLGFGPYQENFNFSNWDPSLTAMNVSPMTQIYIFQFPISPAFKNALITYDILPRGSGVQSSIVSP